MRIALILVPAVLAAQAQVATKPTIPAPGVNPTRAMPIALGTFRDLERRFDGRLSGVGTPNDPLDMLGGTRGIYLEGYGSVFSAELSLIVTPTTNPFRQTIDEATKARVHQTKAKRLPELKKAMQELVRAAAMTLVQIPEDQQVVFAVRLVYLPWEDMRGLPGLVVAKADRRSAIANEIKLEEQ